MTNQTIDLSILGITNFSHFSTENFWCITETQTNATGNVTSGYTTMGRAQYYPSTIQSYDNTTGILVFMPARLYVYMTYQGSDSREPIGSKVKGDGKYTSIPTKLYLIS